MQTEQAATRARIFLMGPKRSGKSSIEKVVFHKLSPHETLFLESTNDVRVKEVVNNAPLLSLQIFDFPGNFDFSEEEEDAADVDPDKVFKGCGALVFVLDAQDEPHNDAIDYVVKITEMAVKSNPKIEFQVLIHKSDGDSSASGADRQRTISEALNEQLRRLKMDLQMSFYQTSIYDHSIFEAFSKIVQKLIPQLPFLENLLDGLSARCDISKAFLFDVLSKIYIATDSNPFDMKTYELCSDMFDVVVDISCIYGMDAEKSETSAFDSSSNSLIRLNNGYILYLHEVGKFLALVCLMKEKSFSKSGLVEFNIMCFKSAIQELLSVKSKAFVSK